MPIKELHLHRVYKFEGKHVVVTHEGIAADGLTHIQGHFVESQMPFDRPKRIFKESAEEESGE
jgi:hypothetical protein